MPSQTINADLCFVPATHQSQAKLPAVSGSSGRLIVSQPKVDASQADYPGRVFADEELDYEAAMKQFVARSEQSSFSDCVQTDGACPSPTERMKAKKQQLRDEQQILRTERRAVRQRRKQEDTAWKQLKTQHRGEQEERKIQIDANQPPPRGSKKVADQHYKQLREQRQTRVCTRKQEDNQWREKRQQLRDTMLQLPLVTAWIAILVITDNCTRQCLGLPIFVCGAHVTAEMVLEALKCLLPKELHFLITDRGTHFTANLMKQLARDENFIHVVIARHRPESNGIAERFVRTLKEWLADKSWQSDKELGWLVDQFLIEYNDRPHQGLPMPGLSPNEYAKRIWLM